MTSLVDTTLLDEVLEAHGGMERWRSLTGMSSTIVSGGSLWGLKGVDMEPIPRTAITDFHRQWTSVTPFGEPNWTMTWTPSKVAIADDAGNVIAERADPRKAFEGHGYDTPWDPLHLAYFNGYAMWTYHAAPFILGEPGYGVSAIADVYDGDERLRGLRVRFPEGIHTHSQVQDFYFGEDRLLRRQDYEVDVWTKARAAHFVTRYVDVGGLKLPTRRSVYARNADGTLDREQNLVTVDLSDYALR